MKKIVLLVSHCPDALINKRLQMLKNEYNITVIYNERGNENFARVEGIKYSRLSIKFNNGHLIKRIFYLLKLKKEIKTKIKEEETNYIYTFRLDMLGLVIFNGFKNKKIVYEVADLHEAIINNSKNIIKIIIKKVLTLLEKQMCKYIDILSITSEQYYNAYFNKFIDKSKVVYMPNIPNIIYFKDYKKNNHSDFIIGFIGFVRYKKQMKMLIQAAEATKTKVFFAGDSEDDEIKQLAEKSMYVEYYGKYNYNTEIANLYAKCDCIYSVYDTDCNNVKYALPNKLYESIYCELPILVASGTYLGEIVEKLGVGLTIDSNSLDDLIYNMEMLKSNKEKYNELVLNCKNNKERINIELYNIIFMKKIRML